MPEWLNTAVAGHPLNWRAALATLMVAAVLGGLTALVYVASRRRHEPASPTFPATLVLLAILIAAVTVVIGDNMARAFSLVGALAIVRFRTVVEDTRDTAFVMLAVVVGMAAGSNYADVGLVTLGVSAVAAFVMRPKAPAPAANADTWRLTVRCGVAADAVAVVQPTFDKHLASQRLDNVTTARQGAAVELTWTVALRPETNGAVLVADLNRTEGVQNVELRRTDA